MVIDSDMPVATLGAVNSSDKVPRNAIAQPVADTERFECWKKLRAYRR